VPAHVNLADLLRLQGRDDEGEKVLRDALRVDPASASVHHALGLLLVRRKRPGEALAELGRAAGLAPDSPDFAYGYAIGLHSAGRAEEALAVLRAAQKRSPGARGLLVALVTIQRERGALGEARAWARKLVEAAPGDPSARALAASLQPAEPEAPPSPVEKVQERAGR
jgi:Flp pilus assembly protein TadD